MEAGSPGGPGRSLEEGKSGQNLSGPSMGEGKLVFRKKPRPITW